MTTDPFPFERTFVNVTDVEELIFLFFCAYVVAEQIQNRYLSHKVIQVIGLPSKLVYNPLSRVMVIKYLSFSLVFIGVIDKLSQLTTISREKKMKRLALHNQSTVYCKKINILKPFLTTENKYLTFIIRSL